MGRTSPALRAGLVALAGHGGVMVTAVTRQLPITFVPAAASVPRIVVTPSGCMTVGVTAAGVPQPPLWGDTGLIGAAMRMLRIRPVL